MGKENIKVRVFTSKKFKRIAGDKKITQRLKDAGYENEKALISMFLIDCASRMKNIKNDSLKQASVFKPETLKDSDYYSFRIDRQYRVIFALQKEKDDNSSDIVDTYYFADIGPHESNNGKDTQTSIYNSYAGNGSEWPNGKFDESVKQKMDFEKKPEIFYAPVCTDNGSILSLTDDDLPEQKDIEESGIRFSDIDDDFYKLIGVEPDKIERIKELKNYDENELKKLGLKADSIEALEALIMEKNPFAVLFAYFNPDLTQGFDVINRSLRDWRTHIFRIQKKYAEKDYFGPAKIIGAAGTGKTVIAMYRAKYLAESLKDNEKILYTFKSTSLISEFKNSIEAVCGENAKKIDVINIDQLIKVNAGLNIIFDEKKIESQWENIVNSVVSGKSDISVSYCMKEYHDAAGYLSEFTEEKFLAWGYRQLLSKYSDYPSDEQFIKEIYPEIQKRQTVWKVFEKYRESAKNQDKYDIVTATLETIKKTENPLYKHIIVDECQDLDPEHLRYLRVIAGEEHENDIFLVGDARQRIFNSDSERAHLSICGINVRDNIKVLTTNYRTRERIYRFATNLLDGIEVDDLDQDILHDLECESHYGGGEINKHLSDDQEGEFEYINNEIWRLIDEEHVTPRNICVVSGLDLRASHRNTIEPYISSFNRFSQGKDVRSVNLKDKSDDEVGDNRAVRFSKYNRVKGLEYDYIFVSVTEMKDKEIPKNIKQLYVALTRARKGVYITGYGNGSLPEFIETAYEKFISEDK